MGKYTIIMMAFTLGLLMTTTARAQTRASVDTTGAAAATTSGDEMILDEIQIEGVVEKPNVTILRNRLDAEFETVGFVERSFEHEMLALPDRDILFDEDFDSIGKIKDVKTVLAEILDPEME